MNNQLDYFYNEGYSDGYNNKKYDPYRILQNILQEENVNIAIEQYNKGYQTGKFNYSIDKKI